MGLDHLVGGDEAVLLALEVLVEGAAGDLRRRGDLGDRGRVPAVLGDRLDDAVEQPFALVLGDEDSRQAVAAGRQPVASGQCPASAPSAIAAWPRPLAAIEVGRQGDVDQFGVEPLEPLGVGLPRAARAAARRGRRPSPPRGSPAGRAAPSRGRGPRAASPRPGRAPPRSGRSARGRRSAPRPSRGARAPGGAAISRVSSAQAGRDLFGPGEPTRRRSPAAARASSSAAAVDGAVERRGEAPFLVLEELVEGDRGDAGRLDDRFDRGAGEAAARRSAPRPRRGSARAAGAGTASPAASSPASETASKPAFARGTACLRE